MPGLEKALLAVFRLPQNVEVIERLLGGDAASWGSLDKS
jgi:hypothetical protein